MGERLHLEVLLVCQVCDAQLFAESVDHGPRKNGPGWLEWMLKRAADHQATECKGPKKKAGNA